MVGISFFERPISVNIMGSNVTYKVFVDKLGGTDVSSFIGSFGDLFYDPFDGTLRVSNGFSPGGAPVTGANASITFIDGGVF